MRMSGRRKFLKASVGAGLALPAFARWGYGSPNDQVRLAILGMGGIKTVGGVGGRGRQLLARFQAIPSARVVALCDVDRAVLDHEVDLLRTREKVAAEVDLRRILDDRSVDAVAVATPNHWHALATVWACQAGKDVYVEKPFSHNLWEGRQMVAAAQKHGRMVQTGTQRRSSIVLRQAVEELRRGRLGKIRYAYALIYRARQAIGKVSVPASLPSTVDYDLWCGPAPNKPLMRSQLHYEWHWFWDTGNGEIGNNGAHMIDVARWALGQDRLPPRVMSAGGRFGFDDNAQTPNTQIALFDYEPAPLLCEIRNLGAKSGAKSLGQYRGRSGGVIVECDEGYFAGDMSGGAYYDHQDRKIADLPAGPKSQAVETAHVAEFIEAVRTRDRSRLSAEAEVGRVSAGCCHLANISYRLGAAASPAQILDAGRQPPVLAEAMERCGDYLEEQGIDLSATPATLGPWLQFDLQQEQFVGPQADKANRMLRGTYRAPFIVPRVDVGYVG